MFSQGYLRTRGSEIVQSRSTCLLLCLMKRLAWPSLSSWKGIMEWGSLQFMRYAEKYRFLRRLLPASTLMLTSTSFAPFSFPRECINAQPCLRGICKLGRQKCTCEVAMPLYGAVRSRQRASWRRGLWAWEQWRRSWGWELDPKD